MKNLLVIAIVSSLLVMGCKKDNGSVAQAPASPDSTAPASPTILIESGNSNSRTQSVTLTLTATDDTGVTAYYASESSTLPSTISTLGWTEVTAATTLSESPAFSLSSGIATKTVYVWFKDAAGNLSEPASDTIDYLGTWRQEAYIKANNAGAGENFGISISLDSDTLAVGSWMEDNSATTIINGTNTITDSGIATDSGAVYVYKRTGSSWAQEAYIKANNAETNDWFGFAVSLNSDTLAVAAQLEDNSATTITNSAATITDSGSAISSGAVYIYKRIGTNWYQEAYIKANNSEAGDQFGIVVSISADTLAVGAQNEDNGATTITNSAATITDSGTASNSGALYIYKRTGAVWAQEAYIKANNSGVDDQFGYGFALSADTLAVGAFTEDNGATTITNGTGTITDSGTAADSGAVYVYKRSGTTWTQEAYIKANNAEVDDWFGKEVSIYSNTLAVGSELEDNSATTITNGEDTITDSGMAASAGAVYIYKRTGSNWAQEAYLKASNAEAGDQFGHVVSLGADTLAVGAITEGNSATGIFNSSGTVTNSGTLTNSGAVHIYKRTGSSWAQEAYIKANNTGADDHFGTDVSLSSNTLAVSAYTEDNSATTITNGADTITDSGTATNSGAVYIYTRQ